ASADGKGVAGKLIAAVQRYIQQLAHDHVKGDVSGHGKQQGGATPGSGRAEPLGPGVELLHDYGRVMPTTGPTVSLKSALHAGPQRWLQDLTTTSSSSLCSASRSASENSTACILAGSP